MAGRKKLAKTLFTTKEVAQMLRVENWRIKNFTEGGAYGLPAAMQVGRGRGSRRLYDWASVYRMLIADELVRCGFTPEKVGEAIREIPESKLIDRDSADAGYEVLVQKNKKWRVMSPSLLGKHKVSDGLIVVPFQQLIKRFLHDFQRQVEDDIMREASGEAENP